MNTFKFASCAGFNNALEFLRALLKLHEDDQVFVGDDRVDNSMSINSMLENNYLVTISIVKAAGSFYTMNLLLIFVFRTSHSSS